MSSDSSCSRLHRLINDAVHPYTLQESEVVSLTKQQEKALLLSLTQVYKQIQLWTSEVNTDAESESVAHFDDHVYIFKLISDLVFLLTIKNRYVEHLAGNIVVTASEILATSGSNWEVFIQSLCLCMELALTNILSSYFISLGVDFHIVCFDWSSFEAIVKPRLKCAGWFALVSIVQALRKIIKCLKINYDDEHNLAEVILDSMCSFLSNVHWDSLDVIYSISKSCPMIASDVRSIDEEEPRVVFLGTFIQLLCSLVEQSNSEDDMDLSSDKHSIDNVITNLVPKLLCWCLGKGEYAKASICQYFRHKLLVLMIRLSSKSCMDCQVAVLWLQLLRNYFQELLSQPITQVELANDFSEDSSPFLMSVSNGEGCNIYPQHTQRQAVFLFLSCSFILISSTNHTSRCYAITTEDSSLDSVYDLEDCNHKIISLELSKWFQVHIPIDDCPDYETYVEKCINFSLSFLQLYMHEDDILFKVLLELLNIPFHGRKSFCKTKCTLQDAKEDFRIHLSNLFNPIHLFHLFLAELHYDHQVLLDYLISKDIGILCLEYLLRCLRLVCEYFHLFLEFSGEKTKNSVYNKRRKILDSSTDPSRIPSATSKKAQSLEDRNLECDYEHDFTGGSHYKEAKDCLLSLKSSLENLHQKNLFLYNPEALLKHLTRFHELCSKQEHHDRKMS